MFRTLNKDRSYLESKYHMLDGSFEKNYIKSAHLNTKYGRMAFHGYEYDPETGKSDEEIKEGLRQMISKLDQMSHPVAKATSIAYVLENTRIDINEHDYFVGIYSWDRLCREVTVERWDQEVFQKIIPEIAEQMKDMNESGANLIWPDYDHVIADWEAVLELGFPGLLERAKKYKDNFEKRGELDEEKRAFFEGIIIEYTAIISFIDRLYKYACTKKHEKAEKIAICLKHLRDGAPTDTYEALQLIYLFFMIMESIDCYQCRSLGNGLDRSLQRFYDNDLKQGKYNREEIKEYLGYFLMQWSAIGNYWGQPFYLGGTDEKEQCRISDLSYLIIETYRDLKIYNPKIQIKVSKKTPRSFLNLIFDMIRNGNSSFVFCSEPGYMKAIMEYGATYEEARDFEISGCYETRVRGNEVSTSSGYVNGAKAVLYTLYNGFDTEIQKQLGLYTGSIEEFDTFEKFYYATIKQWEKMIEDAINVSNTIERYLGHVNPSSMYSATVEESLAKGCDAYQNGVKFNNTTILNCGFATLIDSLMVVKELVYDKKIVTLSELKKALDSNWEGYEELRLMAANSPHKFGNEDKEADLYASTLAAFFAQKVNNRPNVRGGVYKAFFHAARYVWQGLKTQATPDGRFAREEIAKNMSPSVGADKNGVTALINSALNVSPIQYHESACLDVMLHSSAIAGEEGLDVMYALLCSYIERGGMSIQFNVFNTETLIDAQNHPEKYQNLQVRVCGWNILWNNLSQAEQNAFIKRAKESE